MDFTELAAILAALVVRQAAEGRELPPGPASAYRPATGAFTAQVLDEICDRIREMAQDEGEVLVALGALERTPASEHAQATFIGHLAGLFASDPVFPAQIFLSLHQIADFRTCERELVIHVADLDSADGPWRPLFTIELPLTDPELGRMTPPTVPFVGRGEDRKIGLTTLEERSGKVVVLAVVGPSGYGRTEFARVMAHEMAMGRTCGVRLEISLIVPDPAAPEAPSRKSTEDALLELLLLLGVRLTDVPPGQYERQALYRSRIDGLRPFLLLDDVQSMRQAEPLLPPRDAAVVITTDREPASFQGRCLPLSRLESADAVALFKAAIGQPISTLAETNAMLKIARLCNAVPFALAIMAGRLTEMQSPGALAVDLENTLRTRVKCSPETAAMTVALAELDRPESQILYSVALVGAPVLDLRIICAASGLRASTVRKATERLVALRLLQPYGRPQHSEPQWRLWRLHPLLAEHLRETAPTAVTSRREQIIGGVATLYARRIQALSRLLDLPAASGDPALHDWAAAQSERQLDTLLALLRTAAATRLRQSAHTLSLAVLHLVEHLGEAPDTQRCTENVIKAARSIDDPELESSAFDILGDHAASRDQERRAEDYYRRADQLRDEAERPAPHEEPGTSRTDYGDTGPEGARPAGDRPTPNRRENRGYRGGPEADDPEPGERDRGGPKGTRTTNGRPEHGGSEGHDPTGGDHPRRRGPRSHRRASGEPRRPRRPSPVDEGGSGGGGGESSAGGASAIRVKQAVADARGDTARPQSATTFGSRP